MKTKVEAAGKGKGESNTALQRQVDDLNNQLRLEKEGRATEKTGFEKNLSNFKIESLLSTRVSALKTIYDTLPPDVRNTTLKTILDKELQNTDVNLVLDANGNLVVQKKDGSNYYDENNRLVTADSFIQSSLAKNKILSQAPAPPKPGEKGQPEPGQQNQITIPAGGGQKPSIDHKSLMEESLKAFDNPNPLSVAAGITP
jgi:hypothetical protein